MIVAGSQLPSFRIEQNQQLICQGDWTILTLTTDFEAQILQPLTQPIKIIDASNLTRLDSAGAELLLKLSQLYQQAQLQLSDESKRLLALIEKYSQARTNLNNPRAKIFWLEALGRKSVFAYIEFLIYLNFVGELGCAWLSWLMKPSRILWRNIIKVVEVSGCYGMPIIGLLSFLVGIVLAYQMGGQLKNYGANIFVVNLLGIAILREFGPLITAIIVAGRTGSAFAAELGTMKVSQELDALTTMGVKPIEYLVLPKIFGLVIALPLLTMWASFCGLLGGMIMAKGMLGITLSIFMHQFQAAVAAKQLWIGLVKTPVFAVIIASIGCFQGILVRGGAESVGKQTTRSVVQSLFLIIVADAFFSILLSVLHA